jgi:hypothetical protein
MAAQPIGQTLPATLQKMRIQRLEVVEHRERDVVPEARFAATKFRLA